MAHMIKNRLRRTPFLLIPIAAGVLIAGCGSSSSSFTTSVSAGGSSTSASEAASAATGDIPDKQQFLRYTNSPAGLGPEGVGQRHHVLRHLDLEPYERTARPNGFWPPSSTTHVATREAERPSRSAPPTGTSTTWSPTTGPVSTPRSVSSCSSRVSGAAQSHGQRRRRPGLSLSGRLALALGGEVDGLESQSGARFRVRLPLG